METNDMPDVIHPHPETAKKLAIPVTLNPKYISEAKHKADMLALLDEVDELVLNCSNEGVSYWNVNKIIGSIKQRIGEL